MLKLSLLWGSVTPRPVAVGTPRACTVLAPSSARAQARSVSSASSRSGSHLPLRQQRSAFQDLYPGSGRNWLHVLSLTQLFNCLQTTETTQGFCDELLYFIGGLSCQNDWSPWFLVIEKIVFRSNSIKKRILSFLILCCIFFLCVVTNLFPF